MWHDMSMLIVLVVSVSTILIGMMFESNKVSDQQKSDQSTVDELMASHDLYDGVIDRIEDEQIAVILIEEIDHEMNLPISNLPEGSKEGVWLSITFDPLSPDGVVMVIDVEQTEKQRQKVLQLLESLQLKKIK